MVWGNSEGIVFYKPNMEYRKQETIKKGKNRNLYKVQYDHISI